jgi:hypothetical protein
MEGEGGWEGGEEGRRREGRGKEGRRKEDSCCTVEWNTVPPKREGGRRRGSEVGGREGGRRRGEGDGGGRRVGGEMEGGRRRLWVSDKRRG